MQKPFQNWLHTGAICTAMVESAPDFRTGGPGFQGEVVQIVDNESSHIVGARQNDAAGRRFYEP